MDESNNYADEYALAETQDGADRDSDPEFSFCYGRVQAAD